MCLLLPNNYLPTNFWHSPLSKSLCNQWSRCICFSSIALLYDLYHCLSQKAVLLVVIFTHCKYNVDRMWRWEHTFISTIPVNKVEKCIVMNFSLYGAEAEPGGWKRKQINVVSKHVNLASSRDVYSSVY